ncbi:unnamed protein product [Auanema sp. JU1783]|nr:unnamed protein product [Auanema sp. JU1783]
MSSGSEFPSHHYAEAKKKWLGSQLIVEPTILRVLANGDLIKGRRVLDAGCGSGIVTCKLLEWGAKEVVGFDKSSDMVAKCKANYQNENLSFVQSSLNDFEYEDGKFDVAVSFFVLQFVETEVLEDSIKNIYDALNDDGIFVGIIPNGVPDYNPIAEEGQKFGAACEVTERPLYDGQKLPIHYYDNDEVVASSEIIFRFRDTYEEYFKKCGFNRVEWVTPTINPDGLEEYGEKYFHSYLHPPKDIAFRVFK